MQLWAVRAKRTKMFDKSHKQYSIKIHSNSSINPTIHFTVTHIFNNLYFKSMSI